MPSILKSLLGQPVRNMRNFILNGSYRKYTILRWKLRSIPRFSRCHIKLDDWDLFLPDCPSFLSSYKDIFVDRIYDFKSATNNPYILDLGANMGLSVLFFKTIYPDAEITAVEADPNIYEYLQKNVHGNGFNDVKLINKAAWCENTTIMFNSEGADGGQIAFQDDVNLIQIEAVDVSEFLKHRHTDFLKMDIEGSEESVLRSCKDYLGNVDFLFIEYHSKAGKKQGLHDIISIMAGSGFRIHVQSVVCSPSPFIRLNTRNGYDMQLNIFGWR